MVAICYVPNCKSRGVPNCQLRFFRLPAIFNSKHNTRNIELTKIRRAEWLSAIKRDDWTDSKLKNARVCSKHFISGKPAQLEDYLNLDWVPSQQMGYPEETESGLSEMLMRRVEKIQAAEAGIGQESDVFIIMSCLFCDRIKATTFYSLNNTRTLHSMTPVKTFFERIVGVEIKVKESEELICESCYGDLNNIDEMETKINEISNGMKSRYKKRSKIKEHIFISSTDHPEIFSVIEVDDDNSEYFDYDGVSPKSNRRNQHTSTKKISCNTSTNSKDQEVLRVQRNKIHFSDRNDLKNILTMKDKVGAELSKSEGVIKDRDKLENDSDVVEWEDRDVEETIKTEEIDINDHDVSLVYDMMDEKNVELIVDRKTESSVKTSATTCTKCDLEFSSKQELRLHSATHAEDKPYICEVCGKIYRHKSALNIHIAIHNGDCPFQCTLCDKTFTQKGAMMRHNKIHTGEKPYQCEECGKRFTHHTSFTIHKISHSGKKSYKCEVCGLMLMSTSHLKRHMRVHTGEKRYSCTVCGKRFAEKYNLVSHSKLHTDEAVTTQKRKFRCEQCNIVFYKRLHLEDHIAKIHSAPADNYDYSDILCEPSSGIIVTFDTGNKS